MQVAKQAVEFAMPVVEIADIGGLERAALKLKSDHDVTGIERHHILTHMSGIWQELFRRRLTLCHFERHLPRSEQTRGECSRHDGQSLLVSNHFKAVTSSCYGPENV